MLSLTELMQHSKCWSATVLLVEKSHRHKIKIPNKEFQRYIFVDHAEPKSRLCATLQTTIVDTVLVPLQTYIISNAKVVPCNMQFRIVDHPFQWVLRTSIAMEVLSNSPIPQSLTWPTFIHFSEVQKHKSTETNLVFYAVDTINGMYGTSTVQDLILINDEKIPLVFSYWNHFITCEGAPIIQATPHFPIITGLCLRTQEFRGHAAQSQYQIIKNN